MVIGMIAIIAIASALAVYGTEHKQPELCRLADKILQTHHSVINIGRDWVTDPPQEKMNAKAKNTTRVQMELPEKSMQRLAALKDKTEASSYAEVLKNALRLYESLIDEVESGKTLCVKDKEGNVSEYKIFC